MKHFCTCCPVFIKMDQAPGSCCAVWLLSSLMLAESSLHNQKIQSYPSMDAEFHVVQWGTLWVFVRREPQCFLVASHWGETCSRVSERFTPCCRLCQVLFPARQSPSQRSHPNTGNFRFPTGRVHLSRHRSFIHG